MTFRLPLFGLRVLELTTAWAGPYAARLLADMGAEVIKIESRQAWDVARSFTAEFSDLDQPWNRAPYFNELNRNKYGLSLDLAAPEGRDIFLRLVELSDVVIENFRAGALDGLGFDYNTLRKRNEEIILVSMPAYGTSGPERDYVGFGTNVEQLAGVTALTGYEGGPPQKTGLSYSDPVAGAAAAAAVAIALWDRRRTGHGQHIEVPHRETLTTLIGEQVVGYSITGRQPPRRGNRHPSIAPHGVYPCSGDDRWIAIACPDDADFAALASVIGQPGLAGDPRFADAVSRKRNEDALDGVIAGWTRELPPEEAAGALQAAGVPASPVMTATDLTADGHLRERDAFEPVAHPVAGVMDVEGPHWRLSETPPHVRLPAPIFAAHNRYVLRHLLELSDEEITSLEQKGVTPAEPDWTVHI